MVSYRRGTGRNASERAGRKSIVFEKPAEGGQAALFIDLGKGQCQGEFERACADNSASPQLWARCVGRSGGECAISPQSSR